MQPVTVFIVGLFITIVTDLALFAVTPDHLPAVMTMTANFTVALTLAITVCVILMSAQQRRARVPVRANPRGRW